MKYTPEFLSELGIEIQHRISESTMVPIILIVTKDKSWSYGISREHIEDIRWQTSLPEEKIGEEIVDTILDKFFIEHPKYLRKIKLEKINETQNN